MKKPQGFAALTQKQRKIISSMGGNATFKKNRNKNLFTSQTGRKANQTKQDKLQKVNQEI